jgi:hypothetical protein
MKLLSPAGQQQQTAEVRALIDERRRVWGVKWTEEQKAELTNYYRGGLPVAVIAVSMGRSSNSVIGKLWRLGLLRKLE